MDNRQHFSLWYIIGVILLLLAMRGFPGDPHTQVLAYSDFQVLLQTGKIKEVTIGDDQPTGIAEMAGITDAAAAKVKFAGRIENRWLWTALSSIAPAAICFVIWGLVMRRMGGSQMGCMMDVGKSKAKVYNSPPGNG